MNVLITGGAGFIGSHMAGLLLNNKIKFIIIDNLSNSSLNNLNKLKKYFRQDIIFYQIDICNFTSLDNIFTKNKITHVIHFAALKSIEDSFKDKKKYYENNVNGSLNVIKCIKKHRVKNFIFSSTAAVYGEPNLLPINENHKLLPNNPYASSKLEIETIICNDQYFIKECSSFILRYFNPLGSFLNSIIGEEILDNSKNIMNMILNVLSKKQSFLHIYGNSYPTHDGTAVRDFIHIMDLVNAHLVCLNSDKLGINIYNIGVGKGNSILDLIKTFEIVNSVKIPYIFYPNRVGDISSIYADSRKIFNELNWKARYNLSDMCKDTYDYFVSISP
jgi:UDP-glucose 4-epimerase